MNAFEAAEKNGRAGDLQNELDALFNSQNQSPSKNATSSCDLLACYRCAHLLASGLLSLASLVSSDVSAIARRAEVV